MKNNLKIIQTIALIIFILFIFSSEQFLRSVSQIKSTYETEFFENINLVYNISPEIPYVIEKDAEDSDKDFNKFASFTILSENNPQIFTLVEYRDNEIFPIVILIQHINLPPPTSNFL